MITVLLEGMTKDVVLSRLGGTTLMARPADLLAAGSICCRVNGACAAARGRQAPVLDHGR